jgi:hypothetical protein
MEALCPLHLSDLRKEFNLLGKRGNYIYIKQYNIPNLINDYIFATYDITSDADQFGLTAPVLFAM